MTAVTLHRVVYGGAVPKKSTKVCALCTDDFDGLGVPTNALRGSWLYSELTEEGEEELVDNNFYSDVNAPFEAFEALAWDLQDDRGTKPACAVHFYDKHEGLFPCKKSVQKGEHDDGDDYDKTMDKATYDPAAVELYLDYLAKDALQIISRFALKDIVIVRDVYDLIKAQMDSARPDVVAADKPTVAEAAAGKDLMALLAVVELGYKPSVPRGRGGKGLGKGPLKRARNSAAQEALECIYEELNDAARRGCVDALARIRRLVEAKMAEMAAA